MFNIEIANVFKGNSLSTLSRYDNCYIHESCKAEWYYSKHLFQIFVNYSFIHH
jgi:hypothetical protein